MRAWNDYAWRDAWYHAVSESEYEAEVFGFSFPDAIDPRSPYALCGVSLVVDFAVTPDADVSADRQLCPECRAAEEPVAASESADVAASLHLTVPGI